MDLCTGCGKGFGVEETVLLGADEYHSECFRCGKCNIQLISKFALVDGVPVCPVDCSPTAVKCSACNGVISSTYVTFENRHLHQHCFACDRCGCSLVGKDAYEGKTIAVCSDCSASGGAPSFEVLMHAARNGFVKAVEGILLSVKSKAADQLISFTLQAGQAAKSMVILLRGIQGVGSDLLAEAGAILAAQAATSVEAVTARLVMCAKDAKAQNIDEASVAALIQALTLVAGEVKKVIDAVDKGHYSQPPAGTGRRGWSTVNPTDGPSSAVTSSPPPSPREAATASSPTPATAKDANGSEDPRPPTLPRPAPQQPAAARTAAPRPSMAVNPIVQSPAKLLENTGAITQPSPQPRRRQKSSRSRSELVAMPNTVFVRVLRRLDVTVSEAKTLGGKGYTGPPMDVFCVLSVGGGQTYRTSTKYKAAAPFWAEDLSFDLDQCPALQVVVWNDRSLLRRASPIGVMSMTRDNIKDMLGKGDSTWYKLAPATEGFVTGDMHVQLDLVAERTYRVSVTRISNLLDTVLVGSLAPYVEISIGTTKKQTPIGTGVTEFEFSGSYEFVLTEEQKALGCEVLLRVMNARSLLADTFLGMVTIDLQNLGLQIPNRRREQGWYTLQPERAVEEQVEDAGSLRLKICYREDVVLPESEYTELLELLLEPDLHTAILVMDVSRGMYDGVAASLVKITHAKRQSSSFVRNAVTIEVGSAPNVEVLFRGNTLSTKVVDFQMKMLGFEYLREVLGPVLSYVFKSSGSYEVDPMKLASEDELAGNWERLLHVMSLLCEKIYSSVSKCPLPLRETFHHIQQTAVAKFTEQEATVRYTSVSGFLFLRFFVPAIMTPKLFGLWPVHVENEEHGRCLTLIAKGLQTLTNFVKAKGKEDFMKPMNGFINDQMIRMKNFIDDVAGPLTQRVPYVAMELDFEQELSFIHGHMARRMDEMKTSKRLDENPEMKSTVEDIERVVTYISERVDSAYRKKKSKGPDVRMSIAKAELWDKTMVSDEIVNIHFADHKSWEILRSRDKEPLAVDEAALEPLASIVYSFYIDEVMYLNDLNRLEQEYVIPLEYRRSADKDVLLPMIITEEEVRSIFANLASVRNLQQALLLRFETEVLKSIPGSTSNKHSVNIAPVGNILSSMMPYFKIYVEYCANVGNARDVLEGMRKRNKRLDSFLAQMWQKNKKDVMEYVIQPVLRFSSYRQLLDNLVKQGVDDTLNTALERAMKEVICIDNLINSAVRGGSSARTLISKGLGQFVSPTRRLIYEAPLSVMYPDRNGVGVLFNDMLVVGKYEHHVRGKRSSQNFSGKMGAAMGGGQSTFVSTLALPINALWLEDLGDLCPRTVDKDVFEAYDPDGSYFLYAGSEEGKDEWMQQLTSSIGSLMKVDPSLLDEEPRTLQFLYQRKGALCGCIYHGELRAGRRDGPGTMYWNNGDILRGEWNNNYPHGDGVFTCRDLPELSYDGTWDMGVPSGPSAPPNAKSLIMFE